VHPTIERGMVLGTEDVGSPRSDNEVLRVLAGTSDKRKAPASPTTLPLVATDGGTFSLPGPFAGYTNYEFLRTNQGRCFVVSR
jgi:hypothetical protein